jgi:hypothetical protein
MPSLDPLYYNHHFRLLFQHKLQWRRSFLGPFAGIHFGIVASRLFYDWVSLGPEFAYLKVLDTLVVLLSLASRVTWPFLFRDPHQFLHFHRPSRGYRSAVNIISVFTTVPSLILHLSVIFISLKTKAVRPPNFGFGQSILQLVLLLSVSYLYLWMVYRFLVGEDDEYYEPTTPLLSGTHATSASSLRTSRVPFTEALETYSGPTTSPSSSDSQLSLRGHLAVAYFVQPKGGFSQTSDLDEGQHGHHSAGMETASTTAPRASNASNSPESTASGPTANLLTYRFRCRTIARFNYMCQNRIGPHSWLSYPLIPAILGVYNTVFLGFVSILIYENRYARVPSS